MQILTGLHMSPAENTQGVFKIKAKELYEYLKMLDGGWVQWDSTVDTFKAGDPETVVSGIAVGWMGYGWALKQAKDWGCNVFITHEPIYYDHYDNDEKMLAYESARNKRQFLQDSGMVVIRCHDVWDQVPVIGIPDSWGKLLGFTNMIHGEGYYRVYDVGGHTAYSIAKHVAKRTKSLGQDAVQLIGEPETPVSRVVIGTGAITPFTHYIDNYHIDLAICTDDGFVYWRDGALAIDMGIPVIVVNHAVAEIYGMKLLADHLAHKFPDVPVRLIPQSCMFQLVGV